MYTSRHRGLGEGEGKVEGDEIVYKLKTTGTIVVGLIKANLLSILQLSQCVCAVNPFDSSLTAVYDIYNLSYSSKKVSMYLLA